MKSRSKTDVDFATVKAMFSKAGLGEAESAVPLGAGEFNTVLDVTANGRRYALKVSPTGDKEVLSYEKGMMRAEVYWYEVLRKETDIAVPEVYYADFSRSLIDADWFVMQLVKGRAPSEDDAEQLDVRLAKAAAKMHTVRGEKFGYVQGEKYSDWHSALRAMTQALLDDGRKKGLRSRRGEKLLGYIDLYRDTLNKADCRMVNYDLWAPNVIVADTPDGEKFFWIDPERCFFGDRIADFVCLDFFNPFVKKRAAVAAYNSVAQDKIDFSRDNEIRWAVMTAYLGLIQEVEKLYRYTPLMFGWWRNVLSAAFAYSAGFKALKKRR